MHPSSTVGEPVESDCVGLAVAVGVLKRRRLGEGYHFPGPEALNSALARVDRLAPNSYAFALLIVPHGAKGLRRIMIQESEKNKIIIALRGQNPAANRR